MLYKILIIYFLLYIPFQVSADVANGAQKSVILNPTPSINKVAQNFPQSHIGYYQISPTELSDASFKAAAQKIKKMPEVSETVENILVWMADYLTYTKRDVASDTSWIPQTISQALTSKTGTDKEYAKIFLSFSKYFGIEAEPVYVTLKNNNKLESQQKGLVGAAQLNQFDQVVVRYKRGQLWTVLDPHVVVADATRTPYYLLGANAYNLFEKSAIYRIEDGHIEYSLVNIKSQLSLQPDGTLSGETNLIAIGEMANYLKTIFLTSDEKTSKDHAFAFLLSEDLIEPYVESLKPITRSPNPLELRFKYTISQSKKHSASPQELGVFEVKPLIQTLGDSTTSSNATLKLPYIPTAYKQENIFSGLFSKNEVKSDCYVLGPLASIKRKLENTDKGVIFYETNKSYDFAINKNHDKFIEKIINTNRKQISECLSKKEISFIPKTAGQKSFENQIDLTKSFNFDYGVQFNNEKNLAQLRELDYRLSKKDSNPILIHYRSEILKNMAFIENNSYVHEYWDEAFEFTEKGIQINPSVAENYLDASVYFLDSDLRQSQKYFDKGFELKPSDAETIFIRAQLLERHSKYEEADKNFQSVLGKIVIPAQRAKVLRALIKLYCESMLKCDSALLYQEELAKISPNDWMVLHNLAMFYSRKGNFNKVIDYERRVLALNNFEPAKLELFQALMSVTSDKLKNWQQLDRASFVKVQEQLLEAYKYKPTDNQCLYELSRVHSWLAADLLRADYLQLSLKYISELKTLDPNYYSKVSEEIRKQYSAANEKLTQVGINNPQRVPTAAPDDKK